MSNIWSTPIDIAPPAGLIVCVLCVFLWNLLKDVANKDGKIDSKTQCKLQKTCISIVS